MNSTIHRKTSDSSSININAKQLDESPEYSVIKTCIFFKMKVEKGDSVSLLQYVCNNIHFYN